MNSRGYEFTTLQSKWNFKWSENGIYAVLNNSNKPKYYVLDMFPYPSGAGLHVGHPLGYIASDIFARHKRMMGYNVLHPMGFDAFGLPAEQYAISTNTHPDVSTDENVNYFKYQLQNLGLSYDWSREINTSKPEYYKWTQRIFLRLFDHFYDNTQAKARPIQELIQEFEKNGNSIIDAAYSEKLVFTAEQWGSFSPKQKNDILMNYRLAYRKTGLVNRCEELGTVLANDEVINGVSERGGYPVELKEVEQWSLRITAYTKRLLEDLDELQWEESLKAMQRNWIGASQGYEIQFTIIGTNHTLRVFTTKANTIFGVTFVVVAPELFEQFASQRGVEVAEQVCAYIATATQKSELERKMGEQMTGVFTGVYVEHPFTGVQVPVWVSDYVLSGYGTGAVMGVPSEDERDTRFAQTFNLPIIEIIDRSGEDEIMVNSDMLNGLNEESALELIGKLLADKKLGVPKTCYKMRDANFSRQRYWGEPMPIEYDEQGVAIALQDEQLPLILPHLDNFAERAGMKSPLARLADWVNHEGRTRETDTMPGYAGSSWYFLRFMDPSNNEAFASKQALQYRKDVDLYIGGTEHAVGHLLYARFWHKFLYDLGFVPTTEPFKRLFNQGMIQGIIEYIFVEKNAAGKKRVVSASYITPQNEEDFIKMPINIKCVRDYGKNSSYLDVDSIRQLGERREEFKDMEFVADDGQLLQAGAKLTTLSENGKMGKRYHNVINPDEVIEQYGADALRLYEMFLGPLEQSKPWSTEGIIGVSRFLDKVRGFFVNESSLMSLSDEEPSEQEKAAINQCIANIKKDIESLSLNTCVSGFMKTVNELKSLNCVNKHILEKFLLLLAPFAPYITEELWAMLGYADSIHLQPFPAQYELNLHQHTFTYPVCIDGKKKLELEIPADFDIEAVKQFCLAEKSVQSYISNKTIKNIVVVLGRMINIVIYT